jgi:hypothetical protein
MIYDQLYALVEGEYIDAAIDLLFEVVDDWFLARQFEQCDRFLADLDITRLDTNLLVGVLSITYAAKDKLQERAALVPQVRARLEQLAPGRADRLMEGLE